MNRQSPELQNVKGRENDTVPVPLFRSFIRHAGDIVTAMLGVPVAFTVTEIAAKRLTDPKIDWATILVLVTIIVEYAILATTFLSNFSLAEKRLQPESDRRLVVLPSFFFLALFTTCAILMGLWSKPGDDRFSPIFLLNLALVSGAICPIAIWGDTDEAIHGVFLISVFLAAIMATFRVLLKLGFMI